MDRLPPELVQSVLAELPPIDLARSHRVSQSWNLAGRDRHLWRRHCYDDFLQRSPQWVYDVASKKGMIRATGDVQLPTVQQWDPTCPGEDINWEADFAMRTQPPSVNWIGGVCPELPVGVKGVALLDDNQRGSAGFLIGHGGDNRVCIWNLSESDQARPDVHLVGVEPNKKSRKPASKQPSGLDPWLKVYNVSDCVSIDSQARLGYFVSDDSSSISVIDLETFQLITSFDTPSPVLCLSQETDHYTPLTVGSRSGIHVYDHRAPSPAFPRSETTAGALNLPQITIKPRCILHPPSPDEHSIFTGGRFPVIMRFDRRSLQTPISNIYHGKSISSLASVSGPPYAVKGDDTQADTFTLIAACEGRAGGSINLYSQHHLTSASTLDRRRTTFKSEKGGFLLPSNIVNVSSHGTQIVYADTEARIHWMERDGMNIVRKHDFQADFFIKKMLSLQRRGVTQDQSDLILWTGQEVGRMSFGKAWHDEASWTEKRDRKVNQQNERSGLTTYLETMRKALDADVRESHWLRRFGL